MTKLAPLPATLDRPRWLCPVCLRPVIPGSHGNIQHHRDSLQRDVCLGTGLPFHTTGATIGAQPHIERKHYVRQRY